MLKKNDTYADTVSEKLKQEEKVGKEISCKERLWDFNKVVKDCHPELNLEQNFIEISELWWKQNESRKCLYNQEYKVKYAILPVHRQW